MYTNFIGSRYMVSIFVPFINQIHGSLTFILAK